MTPESHNTEQIKKLLKIAHNVSSSCNTISYALYFLSCCKSEGTPIKDNLHAFIDGDLGDVRARNETLAGVSPLAAIAEQLYKIRSILRLFRLIPQLDRLLQLLRNPGPDRLLWAAKVAECSLFAIHQIFEGLAALVDFKILPRGLPGIDGRDSMVFYNLAYRTWLLAISCQFIRTFRWTKHVAELLFGFIQANQAKEGLEGLGGLEPESDPVLALCWLPIGWTVSGWSESQIPGLNMVLHSFGDGFIEFWKQMAGLSQLDMIRVAS